VSIGGIDGGSGTDNGGGDCELFMDRISGTTLQSMEDEFILVSSVEDRGILSPMA
jgi:hypothetical protein